MCAPGYRGRKRGEVVRIRTVISRAHSYQWLGSFGNQGNGRYREGLRKGRRAIASTEMKMNTYEFVIAMQRMFHCPFTHLHPSLLSLLMDFTDAPMLTITQGSYQRNHVSSTFSIR